MGQITSDDGSETYLHPGQSHQTYSFPGLFVGLSPQNASDCDSVRSPTSPLDFKLSCNLGHSIRFPKPSQQVPLKCWGCNKVGLCTIVDSLDEDDRNLPGKTLPLTNSKNILFGSQVRGKTITSLTKPCLTQSSKSLPRNYTTSPHTKMRLSHLHIGSKTQSFSLDSNRFGSVTDRVKTSKTHDIKTEIPPCLHIETSTSNSASFRANSGPTLSQMPVNYSEEFARPLTPREIELSEDYTRVISRGSNPKTTHIFGDFVLDCPDNIYTENKSEISDIEMVPVPVPESPYKDFLSSCYFCKKRLEDGKDIYMYRGEKAFCSYNCRMVEISNEEDSEKSQRKDGEASLQPETGIFAFM